MPKILLKIRGAAVVKIRQFIENNTHAFDLCQWQRGWCGLYSCAKAKKWICLHSGHSIGRTIRNQPRRLCAVCRSIIHAIESALLEKNSSAYREVQVLRILDEAITASRIHAVLCYALALSAHPANRLKTCW